jgi:uncharacterized membrane protein
MLTIVPNWHPLFVHFTIALLSMAVMFFLARLLLPSGHSWKQQWLNMANWSLWSGCLFAIVTLIAGWFAYNSVAHDARSHEAMTLHRNWALPTTAIFLIVGMSAINLARKNKEPGFIFLSVSVIAAVLLMIAGWLGAEGVYRYGLGVMSLPAVETSNDLHTDDSHADHTDGNHHEMPNSPAKDIELEIDEHEHNHDH